MATAYSVSHLSMAVLYSIMRDRRDDKAFSLHFQYVSQHNYFMGVVFVLHLEQDIHMFSYTEVIIM